MSPAKIIDFPWQAPRPAERQAQPARVLILPVIRIERFDAAVDALDRELRLEVVRNSLTEDRS